MKNGIVLKLILNQNVEGQFALEKDDQFKPYQAPNLIFFSK